MREYALHWNYVLLERSVCRPCLNNWDEWHGKIKKCGKIVEIDEQIVQNNWTHMITKILILQFYGSFLSILEGKIFCCPLGELQLIINGKDCPYRGSVKEIC